MIRDWKQDNDTEKFASETGWWETGVKFLDLVIHG